jgi:hypothetical protein
MLRSAFVETFVQFLKNNLNNQCRPRPQAVVLAHGASS